MNEKKHKLKLIKLNSLYYKNAIKSENNIKKERIHPRYKLKFLNINYQNQLLYTNYNFHANLHKNYSNKYYENYKKKSSKININGYLPYLSTDNKNMKKNNKINPIDSMEGYNNYLKMKTNKEFMRINRLLMEETLKRLAIPKFKKSKRKDVRKGKSSSKNDLLEEEKKKITIDDKKKRAVSRKSLFEKEKTRRNEKLNFELKLKFKELDYLKKKFNIFINNTIKLLSEYKNSLTYLKKEV